MLHSYTYTMVVYLFIVLRQFESMGIHYVVQYNPKLSWNRHLRNLRSWSKYLLYLLVWSWHLIQSPRWCLQHSWRGHMWCFWVVMTWCCRVLLEQVRLMITFSTFGLAFTILPFRLRVGICMRYQICSIFCHTYISCILAPLSVGHYRERRHNGLPFGSNQLSNIGTIVFSLYKVLVMVGWGEHHLRRRSRYRWCLCRN